MSSSASNAAGEVAGPPSKQGKTTGEGTKVGVTPEEAVWPPGKGKVEMHEPCSWKKRDLMEVIRDEVALEGLDGITFQALKLRLEAQSDLQIDGFEDIAEAVWNQMKACKYFRFYLLPRARPDLVPHSWKDCRDERGNWYEPLHSPEEIYLFKPIEDKTTGIRGSCADYESRKDVTSIITKSCGYTDLLQLFGNRLVIVAHQHIREQALFGVNFRKWSGLSVVQYCIMERVGRARYSGEITRGKVSLTCMKIHPKTLFYMRKKLLENGLVMRQSVSVRFANSSCPSSVTVFHLPRFYKKIESMSSLNTRVVFSWLNTSHTKSVPVEMVVSKYGKHTMRNLTAQFPTLLETAWEHWDDDSKKGRKRSVRVLRLKNFDVRLQSQMISKVLDGQTVDDAEMWSEGGGESGPQEEGEQAISLRTPSTFQGVRILRPAHQYLNMTEHYRLYQYLMKSGVGGLTLMDVSLLMGFTPLESRSATRFLTRHGACKEGMVKMYKQKAFTYVLSLFTAPDIEARLDLPEKFMTVSMQLEKVREMLVKREKERLVALQQAREKKAIEGTGQDESHLEEQIVEQEMVFALPPPPPPIHVSPTPSIVTVEKESGALKEQDSLDTHKSGKRKHKKKRMEVPETMPESLSIKIPLSLTRSPDKAGGSGLRVAAIGGQAARTSRDIQSEAEARPGVGGAPHLVAVISTRGGEATREEHDERVVTVEEIHTQDENSSGGEEEDPKKWKGDAVDEEIKRRMNANSTIRRRVTWREAEDRFIVVASLASSLFIPKYNYSKVFMYNSPQIRDIMQKRSNGRSNKNSAAIRRRIHFLLHQQSRREQYLAMAGVALRDATLYELYLKDHMPPPQQKLYFNPPLDALEAVINYLEVKFELMWDSDREPDPANSLNGIDTILFLRQLKRVEFYWKATQFTLFMPMGDDSQTRHTFYKKWRQVRRMQKDGQAQLEGTPSKAVAPLPAIPQNADIYLDFCFKFLRFISKQCMVMFKKKSLGSSLGNSKGFEIIPADMNASPRPTISSCLRECKTEAEVRLWTARCLVLEYIFSGKSPELGERKVVKESQVPLERAMRSLQRAGVLVYNKRAALWGMSSINLKSFTTGLMTPDYDQMLAFLECLDETAPVDSLACMSVGILRGLVDMFDYLTPTIRLNEQIFTLNDDLTALYEDMPTLEELNAQRKKAARQQKYPGLVVARKTMPEPLYPPPPGVEMGEIVEKVVILEEPKRRRRKRRRLTKEEEEAIDALMEDDCFGEPDSPAMHETPPPPPPGTPVGLEEGESYISSSNSNALRLLRIRLNQAADMSGSGAGFVEKDFFTLNLPGLKFKFPNQSILNQDIVGKPRPFNAEMCREIRKCLIDLVLHRVPAAPFNAPNMTKILGRYTKVFDVINLAGVTGVSGLCLGTLFVRTDLVGALKHLLESKLIFSVGVTHRRFVSYNNINPWAIPIIKRDSDTKQLGGHVIMRPWINSVGALSWLTVGRLITALVGHLQKPAIPFYELCEVFTPTLSAAEATVLIEALATLKYLTIYRIKEPEVTLWSPPTALDIPDIEYNADTLIDTQDVYIAVSPKVTFLQCQLNQAILTAHMKMTYKEYQAAQRSQNTESSVIND